MLPPRHVFSISRTLCWKQNSIVIYTLHSVLEFPEAFAIRRKVLHASSDSKVMK